MNKANNKNEMREVWAVPVPWQHIGAAIETSGSMTPILNTLRRCANSKHSLIKTLPTEVLEMVVELVRDDLHDEKTRLWTNYTNCLGGTCEHNQDSYHHREDCRKIKKEVSYKMLGPDVPKPDAMDFTRDQKRFTRETGIHPHITRNVRLPGGDIREKSQYAWTQWKDLNSKHELYGYLTLPVKGKAGDLDLLSPHDLVPYKIIDTPNKRAVNKITKFKRKFKTAMKMYHLEPTPNYRGPKVEYREHSRDSIQHYGDLREPVEEGEEEIVEWPKLIEFGELMTVPVKP